MTSEGYPPTTPFEEGQAARRNLRAMIPPYSWFDDRDAHDDWCRGWNHADLEYRLRKSLEVANDG